jgi:PhnB protein
VLEEHPVQLHTYLTFDGQCEAAFKYYAQCLGGTIEAMFPFRGTPAAEHVPAEVQDLIMHARLVVGDQVLMGSDCTPDHPYEGAKGFAVSLNVDRPTEAERVFSALAEKGSVLMPLEQTFWAARFGMLTDQYGVPWMINCEQTA